MANHLIIGLGGTGGSILKAFHQRLKARYGDGSPENTQVDYIYVDSSTDDLESSPLNVRQKVNIHGMGGEILANLAHYPSMKAFISDEDRALLREDDQVGLIIDTGIGGQRRRFGRMLLAHNTMSDPQNGFTGVLKDRIIQMNNHPVGPGVITFHVCAGLAGGTGSGSIVDTIAQLNKVISPMGNAFEVYLYLYVPEVIVPASHDAGYYHANGYAALQEINALSIGSYHPTDIGGEMDHLTGQIRRLISGPNDKAFKQAYLFSDRNQKDYTLPKGTLLPAAVADYLYQRIVANETGDQARLNRVVNCENNPGAAEQDETGTNMRSRNFMSFGISRIVYPEAKIKTYAQERSGSVALTGLLYNRWVNTFGYQSMSDETAGVGIEAEINKPSTQEFLRLSLDYLTLQQPVENFPGAKNWSNFTQYWDNLCTSFYGLIVENQKDRHLWVKDFNDYCTVEFTNNYRDQGVGDFFSTWKKAKNVNSYAACLMKHIESRYFGEWVNGLHGEHTMSLQKVRLHIKEIGQYVSRQIPQMAEIKANAQKASEEAFIEADKFRMELEGTGFIMAMLFDKAKRKFEQYKSWMAKYYWSQTYMEACDFAELLLTELAKRLAALEASLLRLTKLFTLTSEILDQKTGGFGNTAAAGQEVQIEVTQLDREVVVEIVNNKIIEDCDTLTSIAKLLREKMRDEVQGAGREDLFQGLFELLGGTEDIMTLDQTDATGRPLLDEAQKTSKKTALSKTLRAFVGSTVQPSISARLTQIGQDDPASKLVGINILDKLRQDFPTDEMLKQYCAKQIERTQCFLKTNPAELAIGSGGYSESFQICVPNHPDRQRFVNAFKNACGGSVYIDGESEAYNANDNEIVIIRIASKILLRYSQNVAFLKSKYDGMTSSHNPKSRLNKVLLHTETLSDTVMPDLFVEGPEVMHRKMLRTAILMHSVENLFTQGIDPETGDPIQRIQIGDIFSGGKSYTVGKDVTLTCRKLESDYAFRHALVPYVDQFVKANYKSEKDKNRLKELCQNMILNVILPKANNNDLDPLFQEYVNTAKEIFNNL